MTKRPILAITLGDPFSIGPEITVKALENYTLYETIRPVVIGDAAVLKKSVALLSEKNDAFSSIKINPVQDVKDGLYKFGTIDVYDLKLVDMSGFVYGKVSKTGGDAAFQYVKTAIELAMNGQVDATVTNALHKEALHLAGHHFSGHTEIYAHYTNTSKYTMLLVHKELRVVHVSTHVSLREACDRVKRNRVLEVIHIANDACKAFGIDHPQIAVAGLNPHSGENGLFGREEIEEIIPAVNDAKNEGINVFGPVPPDTVFPKALGGFYDIVVAMYHDQGHIPLKTLGFVYNKNDQKWESVDGVNITLGLPIIRTSVDHGTAFDQAGLGTANETSLMSAIHYARLLANAKSCCVPR